MTHPLPPPPPIKQGGGANYAYPNASFKGALVFVLTKHIIQNVLKFYLYSFTYSFT